MKAVRLVGLTGGTDASHQYFRGGLCFALLGLLQFGLTFFYDLQR